MTPRVGSLTLALASVVWAAGFAQACRGEREASSGAGARSGANATPAAQAYVPSSTFQEVMDSVVDPAADYVWESVSYRADMKGVPSAVRAPTQTGISSANMPSCSWKRPI
jgi:hypothetical protein